MTSNSTAIIFADSSINNPELDIWNSDQAKVWPWFVGGFALLGFAIQALIIWYILKVPPPKRPIDKLFLIDQCALMLFRGLNVSLILGSTIAQRPIAKIFGYDSCTLFSIALYFAVWQRALGGCGIALFRYVFETQQALMFLSLSRVFTRVVA